MEKQELIQEQNEPETESEQGPSEEPTEIETSRDCERNFTAADRLRCLFRKEFYMIIPNYVLFLIPISALTAWGCKIYVDPWIYSRFPLWIAPDKFPIRFPYNLIIFGIILIVSGVSLLWVYSYLILEGEGGPCPPFTSKTRRLVVTGPYHYVRHPSILVKLFGVIGLGIAFRSLSFLIIVIPILLAGSLYNNWRFQEIPLREKFGKKYVDYRNSTPALFPDLGKLFTGDKK